MSQLGRISGGVLKDNLTRDGIDLAFDTDLLYLKISPVKAGSGLNNDDRDPNYPGSLGTGIGINRNNPQYDLDILGSFNISQDLKVTGTYARLDNIIFNTSGTISTQSGPIIIEPAGDAYIQYGKVLTPTFEIKDNYIKNLIVNQNIILDSHGTGIIDISGGSAINGNLNVSGKIVSNGSVSLEGKIIIGDSPIDTITVFPDFTESIVPGDNNLYDLGSPTTLWRNAYTVDIPETVNFNTTILTVSDQSQVIGSSNTFTSIQSNDNLVFNSDTGIVQIENISINANTITNLNSSAMSITSTGNGYVKFNDELGVGIPTGTIIERVGAEIGETRWNTDLGYLECFDGTVWQVATGGGTVVTSTIMEEFGNIYTLIFG